MITGDCNGCTGDCVCTGNCNSCTHNCNCGLNANACTEYCTAGKNANACTTNCTACDNANSCTEYCTAGKNANACKSGCSVDDPNVCGAIMRVCAPGTTKCDPNSNGVDTCTSLGAWGTAAACVNQACVGGACIGVCAPDATRCDPNSNGVDTCGTDGQWGPAVACNNQACASGARGSPDPRACTGGTQLLAGHAAVGIDNLPVVGPLPPSSQLTLGIALPLTNQAALEQLIPELQDPKSGHFHQYLTPAQFADSFGASQSDYSALVSFVQSSGLTVARSYVGRDMLEVTGTVGAIESTFFVQLNVYRRPDGTTFYAPAYDPSVNLSVPILFITGLDSYAKAKPANYGGGTQPGGSYGPTDFRSIYLPCATSTISGSGQTIGLFEGASYYSNDITNYWQTFSSGTPNVTVVPVGATAAPPLPALSGSCTGVSSDPNCLATPTALTIPSCTDWSSDCDQFVDATSETEVALDIEMALAMAPGANIRVYELNPGSIVSSSNSSSGGWDLILNQIADEPDDVRPQQISSSWVWTNLTPHPNLPTIFMRLAVQGQSVFWASGDDGAYI
ncbi:MAG TPA: protease pro-enzyme activation domain-containing protein, partial [Polyangiaceae bacterium]|nr:protease pro-enzyme activation domain-containing protein [Polyangiaceae bacterium]